MSVTLDGDLIRRLIVEVADEVAAGDVEQRVVIVVGGSLLALRGMRERGRAMSTRSDRSTTNSAVPPTWSPNVTALRRTG